MATDHRAEAEKHLATAAHHNNENPPDMRIAEVSAWIGTGYATLARNEGQAASHADMRDALALLRRRDSAMREAVSAHIADGLTSSNRDRWSAARNLAQVLDGAGANVDHGVDNYLRDNGRDPQKTWGGDHLPAAGPRVAAPQDKPADTFRRIATDHIVRAFLDPDGVSGSAWARRLTYALRDEGIDLTDAIKTRIADLTLGPDPDEPPF